MSVFEQNANKQLIEAASKMQNLFDRLIDTVFEVIEDCVLFDKNKPTIEHHFGAVKVKITTQGDQPFIEVFKKYRKSTTHTEAIEIVEVLAFSFHAVKKSKSISIEYSDISKHGKSTPLSYVSDFSHNLELCTFILNKYIDSVYEY